MGKNHHKLLNNLEQYRKNAGLTQQELSNKTDVSRKSINAIENGIYVPSTVLALKISKIFNCKVEDLFKLPKKLLSVLFYSTVTDLAKFLGWSRSVPLWHAT